MRKELQFFIEQNIDIIESREFEKLYQLADKKIPFQIGHLTTTLINAGVNPLDMLTVIPANMFAYSNIQSVDIPSNIHRIEKGSFLDCYDLTYVHIPHSVEYIHERAFVGCYELTDVFYDGTISEWKKLDKFNTLLYESKTDVVHCVDGDFTLYSIDQQRAI